MSLLPTANRSFLHGDRKCFSPSEKTVYATIDSLALKRARLPLQLLPIAADQQNDSTDLRIAVGESPSENLDREADEKDASVPGTRTTEPVTLTEKQSRMAEARPDFIVGRVAEQKIAWNRRLDNDNGDNKCGRNITVTEHSGQSLVQESRSRSSSSDYEKIELPCPLDETSRDSEDKVVKEDSGSSLRKDLVARSVISDVVVQELKIRLEEERNASEKKKKKKRFTRNVLYLVPDYLASKGSKRAKRKKTASLSSSLSSLKQTNVDPSTGAAVSHDSKLRSKSLSRVELRYLKISSPTNFVHVASATSPSLVRNPNTGNEFGSDLATVITHEEKCATVPLLVPSPRPSRTEEQRHENRTHRMNSTPSPAKRAGADTDEGVDLRHEFLLELRARSAEILERSQLVKTGGNRHDEGKTYETARVNHSFLWSLLKNKRDHQEAAKLGHEDEAEAEPEAAEDQPYDDVRPFDSIDQVKDEEVAYDDVFSPLRYTEDRPIWMDLNEEIYDDVVCTEKLSTLWSDSKKFEDEDSSHDDDGHYLSIPNAYSSVEADMDEMYDCEQGVYDDVGLPAEEQVNSLYAGSSTGSILGKESEWEDLEEPTTSPLRSAARDNARLRSSESVQILSNKKKTGSRKWSKKIRRSKVFRKNEKTSPGADTMTYVSVSLGGGSVLLVGRSARIEEWTGEGSNNNDRTQARPASGRTQGLVQMRVIDLDEDVDTQEASCYVYEDNASDDSTYESLRSFQPDDFSSDSEQEPETVETKPSERSVDLRIPEEAMSPPTRPNPPPPREASLTQTLGRRIKMLRRTWSITKESLGRMRRRTSAGDENISSVTSSNHPVEEARESCNDQQSGFESARYFGLARHFRRNVTGLSTFYLNGATSNGNNSPTTEIREDRFLQEEPVYGNTVVEQSDPYSILADQEPLYQFYAAAAARAAFDSNSDYYDEVVGPVPQSATDLVRPGHRTLWHQTPQVVGTDLLQRLTTEEKKIQEAKFEILTSEASYLNSLRVLENEFIYETSIKDVLTSDEKEKLFGSIPGVLQASERFLAELEAVWRQDPMLHELPDVLLKYADRCSDRYVAYCSNQVSIDNTLKQLRTRKGQKFFEIVSQIEARPACHSLSLHSFLMLPMQRITRLPLLTDAVLSKLPIEHPDRSRWETVLSTLSYVVAECNEGARAAAKEVEMENLARRLEYSAKVKPIPLKGKHLVKSGAVVQLLTKADAEYKLTFGKRFNKTPLYLLLLTDYLLVAKYKISPTQEETYTVIDICKRSLIALESAPDDSPFAGRNAMLLTLLENHSGRQAEYIMTCESDTERQRWLEAVSPSRPGLVGETLYEVWDCPQVVALYSYSSNQPDELSLHPGDVINVLRKMSDGWFHGEKLLDGEQGWFPGNYTKEVASEHVRARNLKQRHRLLALNGSALQRKAKQQSTFY